MQFPTQLCRHFCRQGLLGLLVQLLLASQQVMQKLRSEAKGLKGAIVSALLSASNTFIMARRLLAGLDLRYALQPPTAGAKLVALLTAALLAPVYALAQKLVFSKVGAGVCGCCMCRLQSNKAQ